MEPGATVLNQQSHVEIPEKTVVLCERWWWTLHTYAEMNYLSDFGTVHILNNENYTLLLIVTCTIENIA